MDKSAIRPAATIIALRDFATAPKVLMGQRGANAAFMPNKFVFPGGAVDAADAEVSLARPLAEICATRLTERGDGVSPNALAAAAIREMVEETGLRIAAATDTSITTGWDNFDRTGEGPDASLLHYFFRAITPPGRTRRFDARFFLLDADALAIDLDDFTKASDELSHLQWVPLPDVRRLNLPFITSVALGEVAGLTQIAPPPSIPFFENGDEESLFHRLGG